MPRKKTSTKRAPRKEWLPPIVGLTEALGAVSGWLRAARVQFAVIGGLAASLHGRPRVTKDIDLVAIVDEEDWGPLLKRAAKWKLTPRIEDALAFAQVTRVLLLVHQPTGIEVDMSFGMLPFEHELVGRARVREIREVVFPLASAEDVLTMKALALRSRDIADIEGILESVEDLDLERVRSDVGTLSRALEGEDHLSRFEEILRNIRSRR